MEINKRSPYVVKWAPSDKVRRPDLGDGDIQIAGTNLVYSPEDLTNSGKLSLILTAEDDSSLQKMREACAKFGATEVTGSLNLVNGIVTELPVDRVQQFLKGLPDETGVFLDATITYPQPSDILKRQPSGESIEPDRGEGTLYGTAGPASPSRITGRAHPNGIAGHSTPSRGRSPLAADVTPTNTPNPPSTTPPNGSVMVPLPAGLDVDRAFMGLQTVWDKGYTGKGVTVAVIDSGMYPHPDFKDRIIGWRDEAEDKPQPFDNFGHGTHVAGDVAGDGKLSGGKIKGAAPDANLVGVRITKVAEAIQGLQWVIDNKDKYNIKVVNMSLGDFATRSFHTDLWAQAAEKAVQAGLIVVVAAGNEGPDPGSISTPGIDPLVITVGAVDDKKTLDTSDDTVASFSSRGPTSTDKLNKPDVLAPGVSVFAPLSPKSTLDVPELPHIGRDYIAISGTSMATPLVSGLCADLLQANPNLKQADIKQILESTARHYLKDDPNAQGAGVIDAGAALEAALHWPTSSVVVPAPAPPTPSASIPSTSAEPSSVLPCPSPATVVQINKSLMKDADYPDLVCDNISDWYTADGHKPSL